MPGLKRIKTHILVCTHKHCASRGGKTSLRALKVALRESGARGEVLVTKVKCLDQCERGPVMVVYPEGVWYGDVDEHGAREIAERHAAGTSGGAAAATGCRVLRDMRDEAAGVGAGDR